MGKQECAVLFGHSDTVVFPRLKQYPHAAARHRAHVHTHVARVHHYGMHRLLSGILQTCRTRRYRALPGRPLTSLLALVFGTNLRRDLLRRAEACDDFLLGLTILYAVENQLVVIIRHLTLLHRAKLRQSRHQLVEKRFSVHTSSPLINA